MNEPGITFTCHVWAEELKPGTFVARSSVLQSARRHYTSVSIEVEIKEFGAEEAAVAYGKKRLREMLEKQNPKAAICFSERKSA